MTKPPKIVGELFGLPMVESDAVPPISPGVLGRLRHTVTITFNEDGTETVERSGPPLPTHLTAAQFAPWYDLVAGLAKPAHPA